MRMTHTVIFQVMGTSRANASAGMMPSGRMARFKAVRPAPMPAKPNRP